MTSMSVVDGLGIALLLFAAVAFAGGVRALGEQQDLVAVYWLIIGGLLLKAATEIVRPRSDV